MMSVSSSGQKSGRRGSRTLTTLRPTSFQDWPGNPYPAAFRESVDPPGVEPGNHPGGSSTMNSTTARGRACDMSPLVQWTWRESNPHFQHARLMSSRWTTGPCSSQGSGGRTHALRLPRPADYRFPTPCFSGPTGSRTPISALRRRRLPLRPAAHVQRSRRESNPDFRHTRAVCRR